MTPYTELTKAELSAILASATVAIPRKATLTTLQELYLAHIQAPVVGDGVAASSPATATPEQVGLKVEKNRPEQNGIKRPSIGGKCRTIWDALDAYREEVGELPTSKVVKELAADEGWNPNNASIEYYQWRKYNGITKG